MVMSILLLNCGTSCLLLLRTNTRRSRRPVLKEPKPPWMTSDLKNAMRDRDFHHAKVIKTNSKYHWDVFKKMKNFVSKEVKKCKAEYYSDLISKNKGNASELWKTFNDITAKKSNSTITSIEADGVLYTETNGIAQALNTHFSRIGTKQAAKNKEKLRLITNNSKTFFPPIFG